MVRFSPEKLAERKAARRIYNAKNRDKLAAAARAWRASDIGKASAARTREREKTTPDRLERLQQKIDRRRLKRYGLSEERHKKLIEAQTGCCAICGYKPQPGEYRLAIDHDHKTGTVRGLLCSDCNLALGKFEDSPTLLRRAALYLEQV